MFSAPSESAEARSAIESARAPFADTVLMCRKCARKLGPDGRAFRRSLRQALESSRWGKVRLAETGCFSLCPKRGQVLATVRKIGDRRLLVVEPGAAVEPALDYLLGPGRDLPEG
ncbi:hypothetical protein [Phenylobacterium sp.]|jgi:hypothetical protein|uniref:hypothetical protein n=1 Tax=Phenylobacterium sp. TaxID=1871053 RepID=UPI002E34CD41|nr:hypothetical protein [Phenylobacterium sp.]HEX4711170.1 hypothetical protein [Phenylobacterium sp.]